MRYLVLILIISALSGCSLEKSNPGINLNADPDYPRWLRSDSVRTDQTSGIAFLENKNDISRFLLADDAGEIYRLEITSDTIFNIKKIEFSSGVKAFLDTFPKPDFEEITYDQKSSMVFLSIEGTAYGRQINPAKKINISNYAGIYQLLFKDNNVLSDTIISIKRINVQPAAQFYKHVRSNIAFEGLAVDDDYLYAGLEGFSEQNVFADSTLLYIISRKTNKIVKEISTKDLGIYTICGLHADKNRDLWGVDRNGKQVFNIKFDENLEISSYSLKEINTTVPSYSAIPYVASLESITLDGSGNLYIVDDPWRDYFIPSPSILKKLNDKTVTNFKEFVPVIFKYIIKN